MTNEQSALPAPAHISENTLLKPAIQSWQVFLNDQGRSPYTIKAFIADLNLLDSFLPPDITLGEITLKDLENFTQWLENERGIPCSPKSLSRRITSLKSFFRWLQRGGALISDPAEKLIQRSVTSPLPRTLNPDEVRHALETATAMRFADTPDARPYTLIKLLLETAIKKGECRSIALNHLSVDNPEDAFLFIRYTHPRYRYKERKIPLSKDWVEAFNEYVSQYQPEERLFPWTARRLEYILEDITAAGQFDQRISFDMLRWTSVLSDLVEGKDPEKIRQKLGISKIQFREVRQKLRTLAHQQGFDLGEAHPDAE